MAESELFVVRIWRQIAGGFRATVRKVDGEEAQQFTRPEDVTRYLADAADGDDRPGEAR